MSNIININFNRLPKPPVQYPLSRPGNRTPIPQLTAFRLQPIKLFLDSMVNRFSQANNNISDTRNVSTSESLWRWSGIPPGEKSKWLDSAVRAKRNFDWKL